MKCLKCDNMNYVCKLNCNHLLCLNCLIKLNRKICPECKQPMKNLPLIKVEKVQEEGNWVNNFNQKFDWR